ncbi:hypothetical protein DOY81_007870 [Sarcophaga bullata]|nr:hypothetical protein DOY81_007870 [Sarcophaga bullata]
MYDLINRPTSTLTRQTPFTCFCWPNLTGIANDDDDVDDDAAASNTISQSIDG